MTNGVLVSCALVLALLPAIANAEPAWQSRGTVDGFPLEVREVPGTDLEEVRVRATIAEKLDRLCDAIFAKNLGSKLDGRFKKRVVLLETETERWTYEQIGVPFSADRDYVMHVVREHAAPTGRCDVTFESADDPAHPPVPGIVRMKKVRGRWAVEPAPDGRMNVTYEVFSNPGGNIPSFLIKFGQPGAVVEFMKKILDRAKSMP